MLRRLANDKKATGNLLFIFNNDKQMRELNYKFKRRNKPTDVLSFNLAENSTNNYIDGEVYVDLQTARRQAAEYNVDYLEETARLCLHGLLHLLGYDDHKPADKKNMWAVQEEYLKKYL